MCTHNTHKNGASEKAVDGVLASLKHVIDSLLAHAGLPTMSPRGGALPLKIKKKIKEETSLSLKPKILHLKKIWLVSLEQDQLAQLLYNFCRSCMFDHIHTDHSKGEEGGGKREEERGRREERGGRREEGGGRREGGRREGIKIEWWEEVNQEKFK